MLPRGFSNITDAPLTYLVSKFLLLVVWFTSLCLNFEISRYKMHALQYPKHRPEHDNIVCSFTFFQYLIYYSTIIFASTFLSLLLLISSIIFFVSRWLSKIDLFFKISFIKLLLPSNPNSSCRSLLIVEKKIPIWIFLSFLLL